MKSNDFKGVILIISGIIVAFFPKIISLLFYIIGMAIIIFHLIKIVKSFVKPEKNPQRIFFDILGIIGGIAIISLPSFVEIIIPLTVGIILTVNGADFILKALSSEHKRILNVIVAVVLTGLGLTLMFNLVTAGSAIRIIAGVVMILSGAYDFFISRHTDEISEIIDVESYTVKDDDKYIK